MKPRKRTKKKGIALVTTIFTVAIVATLAIAFLTITVSEGRVGRLDEESMLALQQAKAGTEIMLAYLSIVDPTPDTTDNQFGPVWIQPTNGVYQNAVKVYNPDDADNTNDLNTKLSPDLPLIIKPVAGVDDPDEAYGDTSILGDKAIYDDDGNTVEGFMYDVLIAQPLPVGTPDGDGKHPYTSVLSGRLVQARYDIRQIDHFIYTSTAQIYRGDPTDIGDDISSGTIQPVATRQVEIRFRPRTPFEHAQFFQNHQAYDYAGNGPRPNSTDGTSAAVYIPEEYKVRGDIRIDGNSEFATDTAGNMNFWDDGTGSKFYDTVEFNGRVTINKNDNDFKVSGTQEQINGMFKGGIKKGEGSMGLPNEENFMTLPPINETCTMSEADYGIAATLAQDNEKQPGGVQALFRCGDNDGWDTAVGATKAAPAGEVGHNAAGSEEISKWKSEHGASDADKLDQDIVSDVEFDATMGNDKPGFAKFIVEFDQNGDVTVKKRSAYTNRQAILLDKVKPEKFPNGILYFEGGNVEIKYYHAETNGSFTAEADRTAAQRRQDAVVKAPITVVAAEHPVRQPFAFKVKTKNGKTYTQYADKTLNKQLIDGDISPLTGTTAPPTGSDTPGKVQLVPGDKITDVEPVYSETNPSSSLYVGNTHSLFEAGNADLFKIDDGDTDPSNDKFNNLPVKDSNGNWKFPGEKYLVNKDTKDELISNENDIGTFGIDDTLEGNAIIGSDIEYDNNEACLGVVAKNWVLLNPDEMKNHDPNVGVPTDDDKTLDVRAVLMSFDHSIQLDDENLAHKSSHYKDADFKDIYDPPKNMTFNFEGSMISEFSDVEGKTDGTGYTKQNFSWDSNLKHVLPPSFPTWDFVQIGQNNPAALLEFVVLSYDDNAGSKNLR